MLLFLLRFTSSSFVPPLSWRGTQSHFKFHFPISEHEHRDNNFSITALQSMASTSYDAQFQIRRDAEERNRAHEELGLWMDGIGKSRCKGVAERRKVDAGARATAVKEKLTTLGDDETKIRSNQSRYDEERLRGNNYFKQGKYDDAIMCYTRCLGEKDALASPLVYSNRGKRWYDAFLPSLNITDTDASELLPSNGTFETETLDPSRGGRNLRT